MNDSEIFKKLQRVSNATGLFPGLHYTGMLNYNVFPFPVVMTISNICDI